MARTFFSDDGVVCLAKAYILHLCATDTDPKVIQDTIGGLLSDYDSKPKNNSLSANYFQPTVELKPDNSSIFSSESFNELFENHPRLLNILHNKRIENITIGGLKSITLLTETISKCVKLLKNGETIDNVINLTDDAMRKGIKQYKIAQINEKTNLSKLLPIEEISRSVKTGHGVEEKQYEQDRLNRQRKNRSDTLIPDEVKERSLRLNLKKLDAHIIAMAASIKCHPVTQMTLKAATLVSRLKSFAENFINNARKVSNPETVVKCSDGTEKSLSL